MRPTSQQQEAIDAFTSGKDILMFAGAGCGKSKTLEFMANNAQGRRGLLLAFNRSVAEEAERKLGGTTTTARNTHRIAYAWARNDPQGNVVLDKMSTSSRVTRAQVASHFRVPRFSYRQSNQQMAMTSGKVTEVAMNTLSAFMRDGATQVEKKHVPYVRGIEEVGVHGRDKTHRDLETLVVPLAQRMWEDMLSPHGSGMRVTHDAYLKLWAAAKPVLPYDFILLDEAQDTNPAVFSVFENQQAQRVSVGDSSQQLFAWNGSLNIMDEFDADHIVKLTQSWRFGTAIQDAANVFLDRLDAPIRLEGNPRVNSVIRRGAAFDPHKPSAVLVRTNAGAIQEVMNAINYGESVHLVGGNRQFKSMLDAAEKLRAGMPVTHPDFMGFASWSALQEYVNDDPDGMDLKVIVDLVESHGVPSLKKALDTCVENEHDAQTVVSTVHKVKGREWEQVRISSDFDSMVQRETRNPTGPSRESLMLYYVAVTRAKELLDPGALEEYLRGIDFNGGSAPVAQPTSKEVAEAVQGLFLSTEVQEVLDSKFESPEAAQEYIESILRVALRM